MRAFALACLLLPGCYLSHERAAVDAAVPDAGAVACDDTLTGTGEFHFDPPGHGPGRGCLTTGSFPRRDFCPPLAPGDILKGSLHSVYVIGRDGRKYVFPTEVELMSWFADVDADGVPTPFRSGTHICGTVPELSDEAYAAIPLGGRTVTIRPGVHVLRIGSIPDAFWLVSRGNMLRPVSEGVARAIYGSSFDRRIYVIEDGFFGNYHLGSEVRTPEEYDLAFESAALLLDELEVPRP